MEKKTLEEKNIKKRIEPRNKAFKAMLKIPQLQFEVSKAFLAYSLAVEPRSNINPRRTLFVECFFERVRAKHFRRLELYDSNLRHYTETINKLAGSKLILVENVSKKRCFYFVDLTKEPFTRHNEFSNLNKELKEIVPSKNKKTILDEYIERQKNLWGAQNTFRRVFFYLDAFFYDYVNGILIPNPKLEKIKTLADLKQDLDDRLKSIKTGFGFFNNFMVSKWLQNWRGDFWEKQKSGSTPILPLDHNLHAEEKAVKILKDTAL